MSKVKSLPENAALAWLMSRLSLGLILLAVSCVSIESANAQPKRTANPALDPVKIKIGNHKVQVTNDPCLNDLLRNDLHDLTEAEFTGVFDSGDTYGRSGCSRWVLDLFIHQDYPPEGFTIKVFEGEDSLDAGFLQLEKDNCKTYVGSASIYILDYNPTSTLLEFKLVGKQSAKGVPVEISGSRWVCRHVIESSGKFSFKPKATPSFDWYRILARAEVARNPLNVHVSVNPTPQIR